MSTMLKVLQITDCHLVPEGEHLFTLDPAERLRSAVADINQHHSDAFLCVLSGDLANEGDPAAYRLLRSILGELEVPYRLMPGNHDDRDRLHEAFPEIETDGNGFFQSSLSTPAGTFLFLDTVDAGVHAGAYCEQRCAWLDAALTKAPRSPAFLFMHHPPMDIAMPRLDQYRILDNKAFAETVGKHPSVQHIFFGHVHRPIAGSWHGIPISAIAGTNHQTAFDLGHGQANMVILDEPVYGIAFIGPESTVVHQHAFASVSRSLRYEPG